MIELAHVSEKIDCPCGAIWDVLTDFGHPQTLAPSILRCDLAGGAGVGAVRIVHSSRGLTIHEELIECDVAARRFRYRVLDRGDMPFAGVTRYECAVTLCPEPAGGATVTWRSEGVAEGPLGPITTFLETLYRGATANIRSHLAAR